MTGHDANPARRSSPLRKRSTTLVRSLLTAWVALTGVVTVGGCQSAAPAQRRGVRNVHFERLDGYVEYNYRRRAREKDSKVGAGSLDSKEHIHEEIIQLETEGYVYHPNFLEFTLAGLFGLTQQDFYENADGRVRDSSDDGDILEFDFSGLFFKRKSYPGTVFARRYRDLQPRPFQSSLETTTTSYGFTWQYVDLKMPTSIQFSDTDIKLEPLDRSEGDSRHQNTEFRFSTAYKFTLDNTLSFRYEYRSEKEEPIELDFDSHEVTLTHNFYFGDRKQYQLESELNYFNQSGTFNVERFRWREIFRIGHTENLESWYRFELLDRTQGSLAGVEPIEERAYLITGNLEHRLFDSLTSTFSGYAQDQEFGSGLTVRRYGAQANFDYNKYNRWGRLRANYRARYQREKRRGTDQNVEAVDERRTFIDPDPVQLTNPNVIQSSIFVTSDDRTTIYQRGRDYIVREVGDFTELERMPTGLIANGQTVLIDYTWRITGDLILRTINRDFGIRQDFDFGLSPYYRLRWQDQDLEPESAAGVTPDDITAHLVGTEFRRGPIRLVAEYEDQDSTVTPFRATRVSADWRQRFKNRTTTTIKARWSEVKNLEPNERNVRFFTIEGRYRQDIGTTLSLEGAVLYRNQQDSLAGDDEGIDVDLELEWRVRETELRVLYEWSTFDGEFAENEASAIYVHVRRRF